MVVESSEPESHTPEGAICLANSPERPLGLLSVFWSPARELRSGLPLTRRLHRLSMLAGQLVVGRAGIAPASRRLKGGSLSC